MATSKTSKVTPLRGKGKTALRQAAFLEAVACWGNWTTAAEAASISLRQAHRWLTDPDFHARALSARREAADRLMAEIRAEFDRDRSKHLRIGIDMLDRMGSADWARRQSLELSGPEGGPIAIAPAAEVRARTLAELERIRALQESPALVDAPALGAGRTDRDCGETAVKLRWITGIRDIANSAFREPDYAWVSAFSHFRRPG